MYFEVTVYSQHIESAKSMSSFQPTIADTISRTAQCRLVMDPASAKILAQLLTVNINAYEGQYGHIPTAEELQQKAASIETEKKKKTAGTQ
jgi:hypothetical protein